MKRFPGGVLRSPVLDYDRNSGDYLLTAVVDEIRIRDVLIKARLARWMNARPCPRRPKAAERQKHMADAKTCECGFPN